MRKRRLKRRLGHVARGERLAQAQARPRGWGRHATASRCRPIPQALAVWDEDGGVALGNRPEPDTALPRSGDALINAAVDDLAQAGVGSEPMTRTLEVRGPRPRQLVLRALPLRDGDRHLGAVVVVDDVSERRLLEAVRRDLVANVSQELRTPVGALVLLGEALSAERSRPVADLRRVQLGSSAVRAGGVWLMGDEAHVISAVANLVDNAVKYSDAGWWVRVSARVVGGGVDISV